MLPVYLGALALGGLLILASILLGGKDLDGNAGGEVGGDADHDLDHDVDHDLDGDAEADVDKDLDLHAQAVDAGGAWMPFLSLRFWTFALACFGATGSLLELLGFSTLLTAPTAVAMGLGLGWGIAWAFHRLKKDHVSGNVGLKSLAGREGRLLLAVGPDKPGKVRVQVDGQDVDLVARTQDEHRLELKEQVLIVQIVDGVAEVTSIASHKRGVPTE